MTDDRPSTAAADGRQARTWLERLGQVLHGEPQDRDELVELLRQAHGRELIDRETLGMLEGVLSVNEMQARDIMIPRPQMVVVVRDASLEQFLPTIIEAGHSRYPVIGESRDEVVGILLAKDLLPFVAQQGGASFNIREVLRPPLFIPESKRLDVLLREFRSSRNHMAVVVDEYGGVAGLVTIEDVLEQIVGEIEDEHDVEHDEGHIMPVGEERFLVQALTPIEEFNDYFKSRFSDDEFDTIGGLVLNGFGHLPKRGEHLELDGYRFTVMRADNRRVHLLEMTPAQPPGPDGEAGANLQLA